MGAEAAPFAFALCWPDDPRPLLYLSRQLAEENRKWFTSNYKTDRDGKQRGEPYIVELVANTRYLPKSTEQMQLDNL